MPPDVPGGAGRSGRLADSTCCLAPAKPADTDPADCSRRAAGFAGCSRLRRLPPAGAGWRRRRDARGLISGLAGGSAARLADHKTYFPTSPDRLPADFMAQGGRGRQPPRRQARPRLTPRLTLRGRAPPHSPLHPFNTLPRARNRKAEMGSLDHVCSRHSLINATFDDDTYQFSESEQIF